MRAPPESDRSWRLLSGKGGGKPSIPAKGRRPPSRLTSEMEHAAQGGRAVGLLAAEAAAQARGELKTPVEFELDRKRCASTLIRAA